MSYARRFIDVTFSGGQGGTVAFNARGKYALRTSARILKAGGFNQSELQLELRGLTLDHIKILSTYSTRITPYYGYNVKVDAGDDQNGMTEVFSGHINQAWGDMRAMPDCPFHVIATSGGNAANMKAPPSSYRGETPAATILEQLAGLAKLAFENNSVNEKLMDPYFWGSPWKQMKEVIDAVNIGGFIDNNTLAIWPKYGSRNADTLFVSPQTGLRDYPSFTELGVQVRVEFKRAITYQGKMMIKSDMTPANGEWNIIRIDYDLQANTPRGNWFAVLDGARFFTM